MLKRRKESSAFWVFLLCMLILPVFLNSDLSAQDENLDDFVVTEEEPLPDEVAAEKPAADEGAAKEGGEEEVIDAGEGAGNEEIIDEGEAEGEGEEEALPALSADPNELLGKVNGQYRAKKFDDVVKSLKDHEDAVETSADLCEIYINSIINSKKPDWNTVNRMGRTLGRLDRNNALGDYAQGLYNQNKSKPDLAKAISFFGKAKSAKKPHPDAAMAYYMALAKKFWMIGLAAIALPIIVIANKIKKKKAAKAALELNLDETPAEGEKSEEDLQNELQAAISQEPAAAEKPASEKAEKVTEKSTGKAGGKPAPEAKPAAEPAKAPAPAPAAAPAANAKPAKEASQPATVTAPTNEPAPAPATAAPPSDSAPEPASVPAPAPAVSPVAAPPAPAPAQAVPDAGAYSQYHSLTAKRAAEIEQARAMLAPQRRDPVSADHELDAVWSKLCRKALQNKIPAQNRTNYDGESARFKPTDNSALSLGQAADFSAIDPNVSIDLSEEALKDDLIGKLKMLAISDGELRSLLAQKNPKHIPHLIEYILSRPEPVRLALVTRELGNFKDPAVIDTLASLLYNEDNRVALAAIQGLEISRSTAAILHICPFLKSDIPLLAQAARTALSNFGAVQILKAFARLPQHPDAKIREAGVFVLSRMKGTQVEQLLVQMLNDDAEEVREKVVLAMSYQKNPVYIDPLREFFRIAAGPDKTLARKAIVYLQGFVGKKK